MNFTRKVLRNKLRKIHGNKGLASAWRQYQIKKYGYERYTKILAGNIMLNGIKRFFKSLKNKQNRKYRGLSKVGLKNRLLTRIRALAHV